MKKMIEEQNVEVQNGDIFFISLDGICSYGTSAYNANGKIENNIVSILGGKNLQEYRKSLNIQNTILFAVKYIGDGILEEMLTGLKMQVCNNGTIFIKDENTGEEKSFGICYEDEESKNFKNPPYSWPLEYDENYDKNVEGFYHNVFDSSITEYTSILQELKGYIEKSPVVYQEEGNTVEINDDTKKEYLQVSDSERLDILKNIMLFSKKDADFTISEIDSAIKKVSAITPELESMAYLDNQLFDFERKGRTK